MPPLSCSKLGGGGLAGGTLPINCMGGGGGGPEGTTPGGGGGGLSIRESPNRRSLTSPLQAAD